MERSQIAINTVSTTQQGLEEALSAYSNAGFRNIEFVWPLAKEWLKQGHTVDDLRALLDGYQLRSVGGFETHMVCFGSQEEQRANQELLIANARLVHELGGGTMVVGTDGPGQASLEALDVIADHLRSLIKPVEGLNVNVAVEFNWSPVVKSLRSAVLLAQKVQHPQVGVLFDPAHYYTTFTKFEDLTEEAVRWIKHVHVDDMRDKPQDLSNCNSDRVLPGQGILDLHAIFGRLEQYGYKGYYSIEMFNEDLWKLPASEAAAQCYQSMLTLVNA